MNLTAFFRPVARAAVQAVFDPMPRFAAFWIWSGRIAEVLSDGARWMGLRLGPLRGILVLLVLKRTQVAMAGLPILQRLVTGMLSAFGSVVKQLPVGMGDSGGTPQEQCTRLAQMQEERRDRRGA